MSSRHYTIPIFIPDLACPHQCIYCNQKNISGRIKIPDRKDVKEIIEKNLATIPSNSHVDIGFFGGNFTGTNIVLQEELLSLAENYVKNGRAKGIRLSTRPDYINENILSFLGKFSVKTIELGAQSFDDEVLTRSGRGHSAKTTEIASRLIKHFEFELGLQMMVGLPGDTQDKCIMTSRKIIELKADCTRIYPVVVIRETPLERLYHEKKYIPLSLEEAVLQVKEAYMILDEAEMNILRVGLHPSEGLINKDVYVAGPFHVSFRELVITELWKEALTPLLEEQGDKRLIISVAPDQLNYAIGYGAGNKKILQQHFSDINFVTDDGLRKRNYHVDYR